MKLQLNGRADMEALVDTLTSPGWERVILPAIKAQVDLVSNVKSVNPANAQYELGLAMGQLEVLEGWSGLLAQLKAKLDRMDNPDQEASEVSE